MVVLDPAPGPRAELGGGPRVAPELEQGVAPLLGLLHKRQGAGSAPRSPSVAIGETSSARPIAAPSSSLFFTPVPLTNGKIATGAEQTTGRMSGTFERSSTPGAFSVNRTTFSEGAKPITTSRASGCRARTSGQTLPRKNSSACSLGSKSRRPQNTALWGVSGVSSGRKNSRSTPLGSQTTGRPSSRRIERMSRCATIQVSSGTSRHQRWINSERAPSPKMAQFLRSVFEKLSSVIAVENRSSAGYQMRSSRLASRR